jgi:hypothetical protein
MTTKNKPRTVRPSRPAPNAFKAITSPSPADIKARLQPLQQPPMTDEPANAVFAKNGVPPAKPEETWGQAIAALGAVAWRTCRRGCELFGTALIAVAAPLLTAAVDGLGVLVFILTIYELWTPAKALADALEDMLIHG